MEEMRAFHKSAEGCPWPAFTAPVIFKEHMPILEGHFKTVFKSIGSSVDHIRKYEPEGNH